MVNFIEAKDKKTPEAKVLFGVNTVGSTVICSTILKTACSV